MKHFLKNSWPILIVLVVLAAILFFSGNENARAAVHGTTTAMFQQSPKQAQEPYYLVTLELKQSTFTLDIGEHIKNKMNASTMTIAVDKRFYDKIRVGQELSNTFKGGSLLFNGDFSRMKVKVTNKRISKSM